MNKRERECGHRMAIPGRGVSTLTFKELPHRNVFELLATDRVNGSAKKNGSKKVHHILSHM